MTQIKIKQLLEEAACSKCKAERRTEICKSFRRAVLPNHAAPAFRSLIEKIFKDLSRTPEQLKGHLHFFCLLCGDVDHKTWEPCMMFADVNTSLFSKT